jgi:porphobilinogen deaminase
MLGCSRVDVLENLLKNQGSPFSAINSQEVRLNLDRVEQCEGGVLKLNACVMMPDGSQAIRAQGQSTVDKPTELGNLVADKLLLLGAKDLIEKSRNMRGV